MENLEEVSLEYQEKINNLEVYVLEHYENLNLHAIWLFVASLGAWSISIPHIKIAAIAIIFYLFFTKVFENRSDKRPFKKMFSELREEVESSSLVGDARKARFYEINEIERQLLSLKGTIVLAPKFLICYSFWCVSFYYFVMEL